MAIGAKTRLDLRSAYGRHAIRRELVSIRDLLTDAYPAKPKRTLFQRLRSLLGFDQ